LFAEQEMSKDLSYQDVMLYPGQKRQVLYCGWFKGLQFDGAGTLFYGNPQRKFCFNAVPNQPFLTLFPLILPRAWGF
jgi:hypothetical protein